MESEKNKQRQRHSYPSTLGITILAIWRKKNCPRQVTKLLKARNWPKPSTNLLLFNGRIGAFCLTWNGFVWHEKAWKGLKSLLCEGGGRELRERGVPLGGTSLDSHCCLCLSGWRRWNRGMELAPSNTFCLAKASLWLLPMDFNRDVCMHARGGEPLMTTFQSGSWSWNIQHYRKEQRVQNIIFVSVY